MKKYSLLCVLLVLASSCSGDSGDGNTEDGLLVKEIHSVTINNDGTESNTYSSYSYNGNKLLRITYGIDSGINTIDRFTYTGNLITNIKEGDISTNWLEFQYEYDSNDRLVKEVKLSQVLNIQEDLKIYT